MPPKKFTSKRKRPSVFEPGAYFLYTIPYGLYYIAGAIAGYVKKNSLICLLVSGILGLILLLLGLGHLYEYKHGITIEKFYVALPMFFSMVIGIVMSTIWGLGARFFPTGLVGIVGCVSFVFYGYAAAKDFGNGNKDYTCDDGRAVFNTINYKHSPYKTGSKAYYAEEDSDSLLS